MPSVDDRIVRLEFENAQFERGVDTSMKSLDRLDSKIKSNVSGTALLALGKAADTLGGKFSTLEIAAITAISNITNRAVDSGIRLAKSLSVDQVTAGWDKYAQKTEAVQTIMAATAKDFKDTSVQMAYVNDQLEKLNWFTDETSYNFVDMVNNIGKFTSNNVALDKSVTAMIGISNWAGISGAKVQEASRAMYNLSQAVSMGAVTLLDWKSIENANMGTYEFKQMAIEAAVAAGTLTKTSKGLYKAIGKTDEAAFDAAKGFRDSLKDRWFTSDVLMDTLDQYGRTTNKLYEVSQKTGMIATELLGHVDEFKEGTLDLNKIASETGVSIGELTEDFKTLSSDAYDLGLRAFRAAQEAKTFKEAIDATKDAVSSGWMTTYEWLFGNYEKAKKLWTKVAEELYEVFAEPGNRRNAILEIWHETSDGVSGYEMMLESVANMWETLKTLAGTLKQAFNNIFPDSIFNDDLEEETIGRRLITWTEKFRDWTASVRDFFGEVTESEEKAQERLFKSSLEFSDVFPSLDETIAGIDVLQQKIHELAMEVIYGKWDVGGMRQWLLEAAGWPYELIQNEVNRQYSWSNFRYEETDEMWKRVAETMGVAWEDVASRVGRAEQVIEISQKRLGKQAEGYAESIGLIGGSFADTYGKIQKPIQELSEEEKQFLNQINLYDSLRGAFAIVELIKEAVSAFKTVFIDPVIAKIPDMITKILEKTGQWGRSIVDWVAKLKKENFFLTFFQNTYDWITNAIKDAGTFFEYLGNRIKNLESFQSVMSKFEQIGKWWQDLKLTVIDRFSKLLEKINEQAEKLGLTLPEFFGAGLLEGSTSILDWIFKKVGDILDLVEPGLEWITTKVGELFDFLDSLDLASIFGIDSSLINGFFGGGRTGNHTRGIKAYGKDMHIAQKDTEETTESMGVLARVGGILSTVFSTLGQVIGPLWNGIKSVVSVLFKLLSPILSILINLTGGAIVAAIILISDILKGIAWFGEKLYDFLGPAIEWVSDKVTTFIGKLKDIDFSKITSGADNAIDTIKELFGIFKDGSSFTIKSDIFSGIFGEEYGGIARVFTDTIAGAFGTIFGNNENGNPAVNTITTSLKSVSEAANTAADDVYDFISGTNKKLYAPKGRTGHAKMQIANDLEAAGEAVDSVINKEAAISGFSTVVGILNAALNGIATALSFVGEVLKNVWEKIKPFFEKVKEWISNLDPAALILMGLGVALLFLLVAITKLVNMVTGVAGAIKAIGTALQGGIKGILGGKRTTKITDIVIAIAVAVYAISKAIKTIADIPADDMWRAFAVIGIIMIVLAGIVVALMWLSNKWPGGNVAKGPFVGIIAVAGALLLTVLALKLLQDVDISPDLIRKMIVVFVMVGVILAMTAATGEANFGGAMKMIAVALLLKKIIDALVYLKEVDLTGIGPNLFALIALMLVIGFAMRSMGKYSLRGALGYLVMIGAIWLTIKELEKIGQEDPGKVLAGLPLMAAVMLVLLGFMALTAKILKTKRGERMNNPGLALIMMAAALWIIVKAMEEIAKLSWEEAAKAGIVVAAILVGFALILQGMSALIKSNKDSKGSTLQILAIGVVFLLLAAAIYSIALAMKKIASLTDDEWKKSTTVVTGLLTAFAVILHEMQGIKFGNAFFSILAIAAIVAVVWGFFALMKKLGTSGDELVKQAEALDIAIGGLILIVAAIAGLTWAMQKMDVKPQDILKSALTIAGIVGIFTIVFTLLAAIATGIGALAGIDGVMANLERGLDVLRKVGDFLKDVAIELGAFFILAGVIGFLLEKKIVSSGALIEGSADVLVIASIFTGMLTAIGAIAEGAGWLLDVIGEEAMPKLEAGLDALSLVAEKFGEMIEMFTSGIFAGIGTGIGLGLEAIGEGFGNGLEKIGGSLEEAAPGFTSFINSLSGLSAEGIPDILSIATGIAALSDIGKDFKEKYATNLKTALSSYGEAISEFYTQLTEANLDPDKLSKFASAIKDISTLNINGNYLSGEDFKTYAEGISIYLGAMFGFIKDLNGEDAAKLDLEKVQNVVDAGKLISELYDSIPNTGGALQRLTGEKSLTQFGKDIVFYVGAIKAADAAIADLELHYTKNSDDGTWNTVIELGQKIASLYDSVPFLPMDENGSVLSKLIGSGSLENFATDIEHYVKGIIAVNNVLGGLNETIAVKEAGQWVEKAVPYQWNDTEWEKLVGIGTQMSELYKVMPGYSDPDDTAWDRVINWLTRNSSALTEFGTDLGLYIDALLSVNNKLTESGLKPEDFNDELLGKFKTIADDWSNVAISLADVDITKISDLGIALEGPTGFVNALQAFSTAQTNTDLVITLASLDVMEKIIQKLVDISEIETGNIEDLGSVGDSLRSLGASFVSAFGLGFADTNIAFTDMGTAVIQQIANGAQTEESIKILSTAVETVVNNGATAAGNRYGAYANAGYYLVLGLAYGIYNSWNILYTAGIWMANKALQGVTDTAVIESPSKVTESYGNYLALGLAKGMYGGEHTVVSAATSMTKKALNGANEVLSHIYDYASGALEYDPVIRPVLDLSSVRAGAAQLNGLLNGSAHIGSSLSYVPRAAVSTVQGASANQNRGMTSQITNNFYVQDMDQAHIDYFIQRINREIGAKV